MPLLHALHLLFIGSLYLVAYGFQRLTHPGQDRQLIQARLLHAFLVRMGPIHIKFGQLLATRADLIPAAWVEKLSRLQDDVPPMPAAASMDRLRAALDRPFEEVFATFDPVPVASASIAQVHQARLKDGREVAVKLVRAGVRRQLQSSLRLMTLLAALLQRLSPAARQLSLQRRMTELSVLLLRQADLRQEAQAQEQVRSNFQGHRFVVVPEVYPEFSGPEVLVMQFMRGIPGRAVERAPIDRRQLARRLQDAIYTMLYMHGFCHGDPHPGNVFFDEEGRLILLDYGITVALSEDEKWGLSSFYYACTRKEWALAAQRFTRHFVEDKQEIQARWADYEAQITRVLQHHFDECHNQWSTVSYFKDVNEVLKRFGAKYTTTFTKVELVFLSVEGFASMIDPAIDIWANARVFTDRYSPYMSEAVKSCFDQHFSQLLPGSLSLRDQANQYLVAPTHIHRYFFPSAYPIFVDKAEGGHLFDVDGNRFVDLSGGYGPHILGYKHPAVQAALMQGVQDGLVNAIGNRAELDLARRLVEALHPGGKAVLCNSGTEACLKAIRLSRAFSRKTRVAKFEGHYHGWSDQGMVSSWFRFRGDAAQPHPVSGSQGTDAGTVDQTLVLQYGDPDGLERLREHAHELACCICEPMPSSIAKCDVEFLKRLRSLCTELGIVLIFDEVVTGFRVTYGGAQTLAGVRPDLTTLGKIIGGGLPCGAVVGRPDIVDVARSSQDPFFDYDNKAFVGGTMSGNSLTCQAGIAALDQLNGNRGLYERLNAHTDWLAAQMRAIAKELDIDFFIEGRHSIFSLTFSHRTSKLYRKKQAGSNFKANIALAYYMRKYGVYIPELHSFMISTAHTMADLEDVVKAFRRSLQEMCADGFFVH